MRIDTPPFKQRTVYAHDVSHREGVCVWPALPVRYVLRSYGVSHRQVGCVCGVQGGVCVWPCTPPCKLRIRRISQGVCGVCMASPPCKQRTVFVWRISQGGLCACGWLGMQEGGVQWVGGALARYRGVAAVQVGR